jgi:hypothetical protein
MNPETGKYIILAGGAIVLIGIVIYFFMINCTGSVIFPATYE